MRETTQNIVQKLWHLCHTLRDDGVTYQQYVTELTWLIFLKMAAETGQEEMLPEELRWETLRTREGVDLQVHYRTLLVKLGTVHEQRLRNIFANAATTIKKPATLHKLVQDIDQLDWFDVDREQLGDLYEGLLEKNATEVKSGAGQYFTPRPLVNSIVALIKPQPGEVIQDPAAGTGGFLIAADQAIRAKTQDYFTLDEAAQRLQRTRAYVGVELVDDTHRLGLMNLLLHGVEGLYLLGDTLTEQTASQLGKADLILSNPPFGTKKGGGAATRDDFTFLTSNKQLNFVQHIYRALKPGGRAAIVLPDNVLFEEGAGVQIRRDMMDKCRLHTILRLPTGIFYAQGVKTNVLFIERGRTDAQNTDAVWVYDMRANMPSFGKRTPLTREHFADFERCYGDDPNGRSPRHDQGESGRWRRFSREDIAKRGDNLDIAWLRDDTSQPAHLLPPPDELAATLVDLLRAAADDLDALRADLS